MIFLLPVLLGLALGRLLGGSLKNVAGVRLRFLPLLLLPLAWKLLDALNLTLSPGWGALDLIVFVCQLALLLAFALANLRLFGLALVAAGAAANLAVSLANGGFMPVALGAVAVVGGSPDAHYLALHHHLANYAAMDPGTRLGWLGDWLLVPGPLPRLLSPGDLAVLTGTLLAVAAAMRRPAGSASNAGDARLPSVVTTTKEGQG